MSERDDIQLTAYALGELTDDAERARIEARLAADPAARAEVERTRELASLLTDELAKEELPAPTPTTTLKLPPRRWPVRLAVAAAAAVVVGGVAFNVLTPRLNRAREVAFSSSLATARSDAGDYRGQIPGAALTAPAAPEVGNTVNNPLASVSHAPGGAGIGAGGRVQKAVEEHQSTHPSETSIGPDYKLNEGISAEFATSRDVNTPAGGGLVAALPEPLASDRAVAGTGQRGAHPSASSGTATGGTGDRVDAPESDGLLARREQLVNAQQQEVEYSFNTAVDEARRAMSANEFAAAQASLDRARVARNANPNIFDEAQIRQFDTALATSQTRLDQGRRDFEQQQAVQQQTAVAKDIRRAREAQPAERRRTVTQLQEQERQLRAEGRGAEAEGIREQIAILNGDGHAEFRPATREQPALREEFDRQFQNRPRTGAEQKAAVEDLMGHPWNGPAVAVLTEQDRAAADRQVRQVLDRRLPEVRFDNVAFADVVDSLRDVTNANIFVDWRKLEQAGVRRDTPVTVRLRDVQVSASLDAVVKNVAGARPDVGFRVDDGVICIGVGEEFRNQFEPSNTESYDRVVDNPFLAVVQNPLSTFSIDVDTAAYSNVRRFLAGGQLPPKDAVRIEELVNYFPYDYAPPTESDGRPFAAHVEVAECPWRPEHRLVRVALKGREIAQEQRPASNLVFLLDVSGSMNEPNKLPLVQRAMRMLTAELTERDTVTIVVYAGSSGLVLPPTSGAAKEKITAAIDQLTPGGSTNGAQGIQLAYQQAASSFKTDGVNRVILCTDGDFNVGVTGQGDLTRLIEEKAKTGVFLSVLGFGMGNLKDSTMESLADKGNGNYAYIDTEAEARKVLVEQMNATLVTIAKDVKIQIEFNPAVASAYRLIGYENRLLAKEDFNDDTKDAGEIGAGHTVTALYEIVPAGLAPPATLPGVDELKYQRPATRPATATVAPGPNELLTLKLRHKAPDGDKSQLMEVPVTDAGASFAKASGDFKFAAAVAGFGMLLRESPHKGNATFGAVLEWAGEGVGEDEAGYRREFVEIVRRAKALKGQ